MGARADDETAPASPGTTTSQPTPRSLTPSDWDALSLGRAVDLWSKSDLRGAAALLETIDISPQSSFDRSDRAAFLLAVAYLRLDDVVAFERTAARAATATGSPYRRWIRYCELLISHGATGDDLVAPEGFPATNILAASVLIETGRSEDALTILESTTPRGALASVQLYLTAVVRESLSEDATRYWQELGKRKPANHLEADLIAGALLRLAIDRLENGGDPTEFLERVPHESRHTYRATHMLALLAIAGGNTDRGSEMLREIIESHPIYPARRDVELTLGSLATDRGDWAAALDLFESAENNWIWELESLDHFENPEALATVWRTWRQQMLWRDEIRLAPEALVGDAVGLAEASLDLRRDPVSSPDDDAAGGLWPSVDHSPRADWDRTDALARHYPTVEEWAALRTLERELAEKHSELAGQEHHILELEEAQRRRLQYLARGRDGAGQSEDRLGQTIAELQAILSKLDAAVMQLEALKDSALTNIAVRTRDMTESFLRDLLFTQALRHFHVEGPNQDRPEVFPEGVPSPGQLIEMDGQLAGEATAFLEFFATHYPEVIARSFDEIWEPRLTGDSRALHAALLAQLARAVRIGSELDSTIAWHESDPEIAQARRRRDALALQADSLRASELALQRDIASAVADRGRALLAREREAIDYHLADASYEMAVAVATNPHTAEDTTTVAPLRRQAIMRLQTLLSRYPTSVARGETRFRLADMRLAQARDDFQVRMARFLGEQPSSQDLGNRALAPFVDYQPAIDLYKAILAEDPEFPHSDAVLFNLGMILSDDGQADASVYLARLVEEYSDSPDCQEAWLRMGNDRFDSKDYAGCIAFFEHAVAGSDPAFTAIAYYKLGWAYFEGDRFGESASAFGRLMDLYAEETELAKAMDLKDEAEEYLVHSLARSGGASAFRDYFDTVGYRDYESRILNSLGHLMRSVSLYGEAIECDALWLKRYPLEPHAPAVAERMVRTYRSWNKADLARAAKLEQAERFLPGSPWYEANSDPSLQKQAEQFAQSAYREAAAYHHHQARQSDGATSWGSALSNYEIYLTYWPKSHDAPRLHLMAGEVAGRLEQYSLAVRHFEIAASSDSLELALDASWQQVAVTDAWYRSSQPAPDANGADSLALELLNTGSRFVDRFPQDTRGADIIWRQGNIAYGHGWFERAAASFAMMSARYPTDPRASTAVRMTGDAHYRRGDFEAAGAAYEDALALAQTSGQDSIAAVLQTSIPLCYYKHAEGVADADTTNGARAAAHLFARVAERWPDFEHADLALYRAGLGFSQRGNSADAAQAWEQLLARHPESDYARDSAIQIAIVHEKVGNPQDAARAYERFSRLYPEDADAPEALVKAIDLLVEANDEAGAERMRNFFLDRFPDDTQMAMEIRAARAAKELANVSAGSVTLGSLLGTSAAGATGSQLQAYLDLATTHPELASAEILAQVDYLRAEEAYPSYSAIKLTQPLPKSIEKKKAKLEELLTLYDRCSTHGIADYSRAAAFRIGQVLIEFGDALLASERPADLSEEDLLAYDEVLEEQCWAFYDRGEKVWTELLQQVGKGNQDPGDWIARTQKALWPRLAQRFLYQPEVDYPLVAAKPPSESD